MSEAGGCIGEAEEGEGRVVVQGEVCRLEGRGGGAHAGDGGARVGGGDERLVVGKVGVGIGGGDEGVGGAGVWWWWLVGWWWLVEGAKCGLLQRVGGRA